MPASRRRIRAALRKVCSQHLWMAVPEDLEDQIVIRASAELSDQDIDASPYGELFELIVDMAHAYHGYGTFVVVYDDEVTVVPTTHSEVFHDGQPDTYRPLYRC